MSEIEIPECPVLAAHRPLWRKRFLVGSLTVMALCLVCLGAAFIYFVLSSERELREALAEADRLDPGWRIPELEEKRAVIPDSENSGLVLMAAKSVLGLPSFPGRVGLPPNWPFWEYPEASEKGARSDEEVRSLEEALTNLEPCVRLDQRQTEALRQELGRAEKVLAAVRKVANLPRGRYPITYTRDFIGTLLPYAGEVSSYGKLLGYDATLRAQDGDVDGALTSCRAVLNCGRSIGDEPTLGSMFIRMTVTKVATRRVERISSRATVRKRAGTDATRLRSRRKSAAAADRCPGRTRHHGRGDAGRPIGRPRKQRNGILIGLSVLIASALVADYFLIFPTNRDRLDAYSEEEVQDDLPEEDMAAANAEADRLDPGWRIEELEKKRTVIADERNSALVVMSAHKLVPDNWPFWNFPYDGDNVYRSREGMRTLGQMPWSLESPMQLSEVQTKFLRLELRRAEKALAAACKLAPMPNGRYPATDLKDPLRRRDSTSPVISFRGGVGPLLALDVLLRAQDEDMDGALTSCQAMINCGRSIGDEPVLFFMLVRDDLHWAVGAILERVLAQGSPSDVSLASIQHELEEEAEVPLLLIAARAERATVDEALQKIENGQLDPNLISAASLPYDSPAPLIFRKWETESQRRAVPKRARNFRPVLLRNSNRLVEIAKLPVEQQAAEIKKLQEAVKQDLPAYVRWCTDHVATTATRFHNSHANLRCAVLMVALERYRRANNRWPDALTDLAPAYLSKVPLDPFDAAPLRYRRLDDGVVVYSIGPDGEDNGGKFDKDPNKQGSYVAGTPQYMAPEQARGDAVDHRADLFSLGSVLYALCAGRPPFRASTAMAVLRRVSEENPQPLTEINPDIPLWLVDIIDKLHAKSPAERFQSAQEVADLLGLHLAELQRTGEPGGQRTEQHQGHATRPAVRAARFRWVRAAALFLPLIAGGLVVTEATGLTQIKQWAATVLRISTSQGTLIVELDDPQVQVTVDGEELAIHGAGPQEIRVKPGEHRIQAMKDGKPVPVDKDLVTISRGGKQIVRVRQEVANPEWQSQKLQTEPKWQSQKLQSNARQPASEEQGKPIGRLSEEVRCLAFSPDGKILVGTAGDLAGNQWGEIRLWNVHLRTENQGSFLSWGVMSRGGQDFFLKWPVVSAAFSPGGQLLATAEGDGTAKLRDPATGEVLTALGGDTKQGMPRVIRSVAFAPDGETLAAGSRNNVRIWRLLTRELVVTLATANNAACLSYSPDGKTLAVGGYDQESGSSNVKLFEAGSWKVRATLDVPPKVGVWSVAFSPDSKMLATANFETVKFWDAADGHLLETLLTDRVHCAVFSPDGRLLATGGDNAVKLWDVATRRELTALQGNGWLRVGSLAFSRDGKLLASGSADRFVRMWDVAVAVKQGKSRVKAVEEKGKLPAMLQERLATLRENAAAKEKLFHDGRTPIQDLDEAKLAVLNAELDLAGSDKERIAILEKIVALSKEVESAIDEHFQAGRVTQSVLLDARDKRLKAEIALEQAKAKATTAQQPLPRVLVQHPTEIEAVPSEQFTGRLSPPQGDSIGVTFDVYQRSFLDYQRLMREHKGYGPGSPIYVGLLSEDGFPREGRLENFNAEFDPKTGTVQAHGSIPNPDRLLLPGMSVRVRMLFGPPQKVLQIPAPVIATPNGEHYVVVVNDKDIIERRPVTPGPFVANEKNFNGKAIMERRQDGGTRIIEKGLDAGDWVVVGGAQNLQPGTHVKKRPSGRS